MIAFNCPGCGKSLSVKDECAGRKTKCPKCGAALVVPHPPAQATAPAVQPAAPTEPRYYFVENGQRYGPASMKQLQERVAAQRLRPDDLVWREGAPQWVAAQAMPELFEAAQAMCAFCQKPMPPEAPQCSQCRNWRRDIHLLIEKYKKLTLAAHLGLAVGGLVAMTLFVIGVTHRSAWTSFHGLRGDFSFEKFVGTPFFAFGLLFAILAVVAYVVFQIPAARTRRQIQEQSSGLWRRPWWSY